MRLTRSISLDWAPCQKVRRHPLAHPYKKCCSSEAPRPPLRRGRHMAGLPGNVDMITRSALTPVLESVAALPAGHPADLPVMVDNEGLTFYNVGIVYPGALGSIRLGHL